MNILRAFLPALALVCGGLTLVNVGLTSPALAQSGSELSRDLERAGKLIGNGDFQAAQSILDNYDVTDGNDEAEQLSILYAKIRAMEGQGDYTGIIELTSTVPSASLETLGQHRNLPLSRYETLAKVQQENAIEAPRMRQQVFLLDASALAKRKNYFEAYILASRVAPDYNDIWLDAQSVRLQSAANLQRPDLYLEPANALLDAGDLTEEGLTYIEQTIQTGEAFENAWASVRDQSSKIEISRLDRLSRSDDRVFKSVHVLENDELLLVAEEGEGRQRQGRVMRFDPAGASQDVLSISLKHARTIHKQVNEDDSISITARRSGPLSETHELHTAKLNKNGRLLKEVQVQIEPRNLSTTLGYGNILSWSIRREAGNSAIEFALYDVSTGETSWEMSYTSEDVGSIQSVRGTRMFQVDRETLSCLMVIIGSDGLPHFHIVQINLNDGTIKNDTRSKLLSPLVANTQTIPLPKGGWLLNTGKTIAALSEKGEIIWDAKDVVDESVLGIKMHSVSTEISFVSVVKRVEDQVQTCFYFMAAPEFIDQEKPSCIAGTAKHFFGTEDTLFIVSKQPGMFPTLYELSADTPKKFALPFWEEGDAIAMLSRSQLQEKRNLVLDLDNIHDIIPTQDGGLYLIAGMDVKVDTLRGVGFSTSDIRVAYFDKTAQLKWTKTIKETGHSAFFRRFVKADVLSNERLMLAWNNTGDGLAEFSIFSTDITLIGETP